MNKLLESIYISRKERSLEKSYDKRVEDWTSKLIKEGKSPELARQLAIARIEADNVVQLSEFCAELDKK